MTGELPTPPSDGNGFVAYERATVDRFFDDAFEERARLLSKMATARRRIAEAKVALAAATDSEYSCIRAVLDAQRALREEQRANETTIAAVHAHAAAHAEQIVHDAGARARARSLAVATGERPHEREGRLPDGREEGQAPAHSTDAAPMRA